MGRLTDALKRSRAGTAGSPPLDAGDGNQIQFFDPKQPAAAIPWNIGTGPERPRQAPVPISAPPVAAPPVSVAASPVAVPAPAMTPAATRAAKSARTRREPRQTRPKPQSPEAPKPHRWPDNESTEKLVVSPSLIPTAREWYRQLAATLHQAQLEHNIGAVMVTSAVPGEGKTLTTTNLALTLSESYQRRVLLIDADLRRPTVHTLLGVPNTTGLREALVSEDPLPLIHVNAHLSVLLGGAAEDDPMKTLASDRMRTLIQNARARFDWVLLDTPPVGLLPDEKVLASAVDVALLVVKAGRTPYDVVQAAAEAVGKERIFGVVLNSAAESDIAALSYGSYGYGYGYESTSRAR